MTNEYNEQHIDALVKHQLNDKDKAILEQVMAKDDQVRTEVDFRQSLTQVLSWRKQLQEAHQYLLEDHQPIDIDNYVKGKMTSADEEQFELLLSHDEVLQKEVAFRQDVIAVLKMRKQIATAQQSMQQQQASTPMQVVASSAKGRVMGLRRILSYAAGVLVLVIAGLGYAGGNYSNEALSDLGTEKLALQASSFKSGNQPTPKDIFEEGLLAMGKEEWSAAQSYFQQYDSSSPHHEAAQLYLSYIFFQNKNYHKAITSATIATTSNSEERRMKAEWLLLQAQLADDQLSTEFYQLLEKVAMEKGHPFRKEAQKLQANLASTWRILTF